MLRTILSSAKEYLTDWKNILMHSLIGVSILVIALFLPVDVIFRVALLMCVVMFNLGRMYYEKTRAETTDIVPDSSLD